MAWRVLVAENEPDLGALMTNALGEPAFDVVVCTDAESALVSLRRDSPYDTVICDAKLPGMSGLEFVQAVRLRREFAKLPVLMVGDYARYDMESRAKGAGANHFLSKPFTGAQVRSVVTELASHYRPLSAADRAALNGQSASKPATPLDPMLDPTPSSVIRIPTPEMLAEMMRRRPPK